MGPTVWAQDEETDETVFSSEDGLITVQRPVPGAWECVQSRQKLTEKKVETVVTQVKCRPEAARQIFFMTARDYTRAPKDKDDAKDIATKHHRRAYKQLYANLTYSSSTAVTHNGFPAWEVWFDAVHERLGPVRKRERVIAIPEHVLVLSAEGAPEMVEEMAPQIEAWFAGTKFASLGAVPPAPTE